VDPDCADALVGSCEHCSLGCGTGSCPSNIAPRNNAVCLPGSWMCSANYFASDDGCDCGCGALDLDCASANSSACGYCNDPGSCGSGACPDNIRTSNNAVCQSPPAGWTCYDGFYGSNDGCDCGCGFLDPDCPDALDSSCDYCNMGGSCNTATCPGTIDPDNNATCN
jgi:hypothetical protein